MRGAAPDAGRDAQGRYVYLVQAQSHCGADGGGSRIARKYAHGSTSSPGARTGSGHTSRVLHQIAESAPLRRIEWCDHQQRR
jgi:hypothetical protein